MRRRKQRYMPVPKQAKAKHHDEESSPSSMTPRTAVFAHGGCVTVARMERGDALSCQVLCK